MVAAVMRRVFGKGLGTKQAFDGIWQNPLSTYAVDGSACVAPGLLAQASTCWDGGKRKHKGEEQRGL